MDKGGTKNRTLPIDPETAGPIRSSESDAITVRVVEVVGNEPVAAFARRCGLGESILRKYIAGSVPRADYLSRIADAGAVTVDWLATGRPPKTRAELRAMQEAASAPRIPLDMDVLAGVVEAVEEYLQKRKLQLRPDKKAALVTLLYDKVASGAAIEPAILERFIKLAS